MKPTLGFEFVLKSRTKRNSFDLCALKSRAMNDTAVNAGFSNSRVPGLCYAVFPKIATVQRETAKTMAKLPLAPAETGSGLNVKRGINKFSSKCNLNHYLTYTVSLLKLQF